jgi:hypothetical protein
MNFQSSCKNNYESVPRALFIWVYDSADRPFTSVELSREVPDGTETEEGHRSSRIPAKGGHAIVGEVVGKQEEPNAHPWVAEDRWEVARG